MSEKKPYRWCFVPLCKNKELNSPNKVFFSVPENEKKRRLWFKVARRLDPFTISKYYCCEDHFNIKEDMENYVCFCLMGGMPKLKPDVIPHIFDCHPTRYLTHQNIRMMKC